MEHQASSRTKAAAVLSIKRVNALLFLAFFASWREIYEMLGLTADYAMYADFPRGKGSVSRQPAFGSPSRVAAGPFIARADPWDRKARAESV
jgi:hypothetical protein